VSGIVAFSFVQARRCAVWCGRRAELIEGVERCGRIEPDEPTSAYLPALPCNGS
jgi:hypothetical protein